MSAAVDKKRAVTIKVLFWIIFVCFILVVTTIFTPDFMEEFIGFEIGFFVFGGIAVAFIAGAIGTIVMIAKKII